MSKKIITIAIMGLMTASSAAFANSALLDAFIAKYPAAAKGRLDNCATCHSPMTSGTVNAYGAAAQKANLDFAAIEKDDSDGDGVANLDEITAGTNPGSKASDAEVFVFPGPTRGNVTFNHGKHITDPAYKIMGNCSACHGTGTADTAPHFNKVFDPAVSIKDVAHATCKSCHAANQPGAPSPMCTSCHVR